MEFDPEILVRAVWAGMPVVSMPTNVTYPIDGVSHFKMWRDNVRISWMHTRLFFGMLWRAPRAAGAAPASMNAKHHTRSHSITVKVPFHDLDPVGHRLARQLHQVFRDRALRAARDLQLQLRRDGALGLLVAHHRSAHALREGGAFRRDCSMSRRRCASGSTGCASTTSRPAPSGLRVCKGTSIQVAVDMKTQEMCLKSPDILFQRLGLAVKPVMSAPRLLRAAWSRGRWRMPPTPAPPRYAEPRTACSRIRPRAAQLADATCAHRGSIAKAQGGARPFVQRRYLAGLAQPLESSGTFLFARGSGIEWHTEQPFDSQFVLTDSGITQRDEGGVPLRNLRGGPAGARGGVARVLRAVRARSRFAVARFRALGEHVGKAGWVIGLRPRDRGAGQRLPPGVVSGGVPCAR